MNYKYLSHSGVKGMKWGVRHDKKSSGSRSRKNKSERTYKKTYNQTVKSRKKSKYKDISKLSDQELRSRINRMQMERQYASLLKDQSHAVKRGKNKTDGILKTEGKRFVSKTIRSYTNIPFTKKKK